MLLVWFYFWWEAHNDYNEFNWLLYNRSGEWSDGTVPILATTAAGFTYVAFLMILALCHIALGQQLNLHWLHKIGVAAALLTTVVGVISVNQTWEQEWDIVPISLQVRNLDKSPQRWRQSVVLFLHILSLRVSNCGIVTAVTPHLCPALSLSITSVDGVPFLMHNLDLRRTTDVEKVFPERQTLNASSFNWTDLQQLNAGEWFLKDDPFWTVPSLSPSERIKIANQSVCSLEELLKLASITNSSLVFRLQRPPPDHPHHHSWINDTLKVVQQSGIPQRLVMWTTDEQRAEVRQQAPGLIQTSLVKCSLQSLQQSDVSRMLLRYNRVSTNEVRCGLITMNFSQSHIDLTLYTVNDPWLYSVLWCSGVSAVSSEAPHVLKKVPYPSWLMRPNEYCLMWVSADLISFAVIVGIFILQNYHIIRYRMSGMRSYNPEQIMLSASVRTSSRDVNVMKEKLIFSEVRNDIGADEEPYMDGYNYYTNQSVIRGV
uniref:Glycerophosphodiester phosphodiesterase domain containing 5b n=1 Tax=Oryzias sinensis TaxID=183150 RepID=A0A8C7YJH7_9TELE